MFDTLLVGGLFGKPVVRESGPSWSGILVVDNTCVPISDRETFASVLSSYSGRVPHVFLSTATENLKGVLPIGRTETVLSKVVDLPLIVRILHGARADEERIHTLDVLKREVVGCTDGTISEQDALGLLTGLTAQRSRFGDLTAFLRRFLCHLLHSLAIRAELRRYLRYELPAHRALLMQSTRRLEVNSDGLSSLVRDLDESLRAERSRLVLDESTDPRDLLSSPEARSGFVERIVGRPGSFLSRGELRDFVADRADTDPLCRKLSDYYKGENSRRALAELAEWAPEGCPVEYDCLGTVTGRVIMRSPGVQWLEKRYRHVIAPPQAHELRYLDYSCYEPTILAVASGDSVLLDACGADLYSQVAEWLGLSHTGSRDVAKSLFLRFLYGQARERLVADLSEKTGTTHAHAEERFAFLEKSIPVAIAFRDELQEVARQTRRLRTKCGNCRQTSSVNSYKAMSYFLQGTGAIIYKLALSRIFAPPSPSILIVPMHDAFLCGFPSNAAEALTQAAQRDMRKAFADVMGRDVVRVTVSTFFS
jgi:hypothetical protein